MTNQIKPNASTEKQIKQKISLFPIAKKLFLKKLAPNFCPFL